MARKVVNRLERRQENEAAERRSGKKEEAAKAAVAKPKRKSRSKAAKEVRLKAFWGVYNQSMKRMARFEYSQRAEADKKADELTKSQKTPHFVKLDKEAIEE